MHIWKHFCCYQSILENNNQKQKKIIYNTTVAPTSPFIIKNQFLHLTFLHAELEKTIRKRKAEE